ncbi:hypothetical protein Tco_1118793, partial [Tanacetum coccineum]
MPLKPAGLVHLPFDLCFLISDHILLTSLIVAVNLAGHQLRVYVNRQRLHSYFLSDLADEDQACARTFDARCPICVDHPFFLTNLLVVNCVLALQGSYEMLNAPSSMEYCASLPDVSA